MPWRATRDERWMRALIMDGYMPLLLKSFLDTYFSEPDDWRIFLLKNWSTVVGTLHTKMRLEKIQDDMLVIAVYDVHWMHELFMLSSSIIKTINAKLDQPHVKKVRFIVAERAEKKPEKKIIKKTFLPTKVHSLTSHQRQILSAINDHELQEVLKKFLMRCESMRA